MLTLREFSSEIGWCARRIDQCVKILYYCSSGS
nr:MAG TPA: hypothetical protein [Caudoviricetes sp.]